MKGIMLGNLMPDQIENRTGIKLSEEHKQMLMETHQPKAENIEKGKWHCFDLPFVFVCGDKETAHKFLAMFNAYDWREAKESMMLSWEEAI